MLELFAGVGVIASVVGVAVLAIKAADAHRWLTQLRYDVNNTTKLAQTLAESAQRDREETRAKLNVLAGKVRNKKEDIYDHPS